MNRSERTDAAREAIREAVSKGFMDCKTLVRALFPERFPDDPVRWDAAYNWCERAGVAVVYIAPDGETDVRKSERTGCWSDDFPRILAYKEAYYQQIAVNDWDASVRGMIQQGVSREKAVKLMPARPRDPAFFVDTAWKASGTKARDEAPQTPATFDTAKKGDTEMETRDKTPQEKPTLRHCHFVPGRSGCQRSGAIYRGPTDDSCRAVGHT